MSDEPDKSGKRDAITGLSGLPATVVKLGMAGMILLMLAKYVMYDIPADRQAAREHGERAVNRLGDAIDRQTQTILDVQAITHENQRKLIAGQKKDK